MSEKPGKRAERHHRQLHQFGERQQWRCAYCGCPIRCRTCQTGDTLIATWDHVIPRARGGSRTPKSNLVLACSPCNCEKGDSLAGSGRVAWRWVELGVALTCWVTAIGILAWLTLRK